MIGDIDPSINPSSFVIDDNHGMGEDKEEHGGCGQGWRGQTRSPWGGIGPHNPHMMCMVALKMWKVGMALTMYEWHSALMSIGVE